MLDSVREFAKDARRSLRMGRRNYTVFTLSLIYT